MEENKSETDDIEVDVEGKYQSDEDLSSIDERLECVDREELILFGSITLAIVVILCFWIICVYYT